MDILSLSSDKISEDSRLQSCLQTRSCEKIYLFCKNQFSDEKMSVRHKTQQQISWGKLQRSMASTVYIDHVWEPVSFLQKWLGSLPLLCGQQAEYLTIRYHPTVMAVLTEVSFLWLKLSVSTKVLVVLKGYCQLSTSNFYPGWSYWYLLGKVFLLS